MRRQGEGRRPTGNDLGRKGGYLRTLKGATSSPEDFVSTVEKTMTTDLEGEIIGS